MVRTLLTAFITTMIAGASLLLGLTGHALSAGRLSPLDWLLPGTVAIIMLALWAAWQHRRGGAQAASKRLAVWPLAVATWTAITAPVLIMLAQAGSTPPVGGMLLLALGLALGCAISFFAAQRAMRTRVLLLFTCLIVAIAAPMMIARADGAGGHDAGAERPVIAVLTALPLHGVTLGAAQGLPPSQSIGLRSPLWQLLAADADLRPIDAVDRRELNGVDAVLLAQPRLLAPVELVALDAWVRQGGRVVILADPLLHWPDPRSIADPARAPLTSLLDPLLTHWGLRLEPAQMDLNGDGRHGGPERRLLEGGVLVQLAGASRFVHAATPGCVLSDEGLVARCAIGKGQALLMADADWIDDMLWTLSPETPSDRRFWTSDAPLVLAAWVQDRPLKVPGLSTWITDQAALIHAIRLALLALLPLGLGWAAVARFPQLAKWGIGTSVYQMENKRQTRGRFP